FFEWTWRNSQVHSKNLVYNTCWEDPRCDRALLQLNESSDVVMISSAGCNALSYLIDQPNSIHAVDLNYRQNALVELKKAFFQIDAYNYLFKFFGEGKSKRVRKFYKTYLRDYLSEDSQKYWDRKIYYFNGRGFRNSFYYHGTSGMLAYAFINYVKIKSNLNYTIDSLLHAHSLELQVANYSNLEKALDSKFFSWLLNQHLIMSLAGVPESQQDLFRNEQNTTEYLKPILKNVFTQLPISDNYFWKLYYNGYYDKTCCPDYLKEEHFPKIKNQIDKLNVHTKSISEFLKDNPGVYSHYILLDHQDWLAKNNKPALEEEWQLILKNATRGTKILLRSASTNIDFYPDFVKDRVEFKKELSDAIHTKDRVGTYGSTALMIVK
ncbi:MAG: BtaA family protein, partial [Bacteroidota bacterium]